MPVLDTAPRQEFHVSEVDRILAVLRGMDERNAEAWMTELNARKRDEMEFHDKLTTTEAQPAAEDTTKLRESTKKFYRTVELSRNYTRNWIETHGKGKIILDFACGLGENAIHAAKHGAALAIGLDISRSSIDRCRETAARDGVAANTFFVQGDCESTGLPDNSVDTVICSGMLHHLDLTYVFPELRRILKPGGRCLAVEALNYNPLIKLYRWLTPEMRTEWEKTHILSMKDVRFARWFFDVQSVYCWHLCSIGAGLLSRTPLFGPCLKVANWIDRAFLSVYPLKLMGWIITFEMVKKPER
jgi:SAM-dependent methyltransferase